MPKQNKYDLEERTAQFGEDIIKLAKTVPKSTITIPILNQLMRSGTSLGANYMEANGASSKKDFKNKIHLCKKESMETKYWLRMLAEAHSELKEQCRRLWQEVHELTLIFSKIASSSK